MPCLSRASSRAVAPTAASLTAARGFCWDATAGHGSQVDGRSVARSGQLVDRMRAGSPDVFAFDVLELDGRDLCAQSWTSGASVVQSLLLA
jgi:hypothetical protein